MDYFLGQIILTAFSRPMNGWALCNGQALPISGNEALYAIMGTTYGGDGKKFFNLPNLSGSVPIGSGQGTAPGATAHALGNSGGAETVTLTAAQVPAHSHAVYASPANSSTVTFGPTALYGSDTSNAKKHYINPVPNPEPTALNLSVDSISNAGKSQSHVNVMPGIALCYQICIKGLFPYN